MKKVAVIGSGVSGMGAAYALKDHFDVHVFEKADYVGGHTSTVDVDEGDRVVGVDTAFMVCNPVNYPKLFKLFETLGVEVSSHSGGFNFFDLDTNEYFGTPELEKDEAFVKEHYSAEFHEIWRQAERLHSEALHDLVNGKTFISLRQYLSERGYTKAFMNGYLLQLITAYWSLPIEEMLEMPASTVLGFFSNHGKGGLGGKKISWFTVEGGSKRYLEKIQAALPRPVALNAPVEALRPHEGGVVLRIGGQEAWFDYAIAAAHADQTLRILAEPTDFQASMLSAFHYHPSETVLHTDAAVIPVPRHRWASWNYGRISRDGQVQPFLVYHMNSIQGFDAKNDYFVSLDSPIPIDPAKVVKAFHYEHPVLDMGSYAAQKELQKINRGGPIYFAGSYFSVKTHGPDFAGFHESGYASGAEAARSLLRDASPAA